MKRPMCRFVGLIILIKLLSPQMQGHGAEIERAVKGKGRIFLIYGKRDDHVIDPRKGWFSKAIINPKIFSILPQMI